MAQHNTVFSRILKLIPDMNSSRWPGSTIMVVNCAMTRWSQFVSPGLPRLAVRMSQRDVVSKLRAQDRKLCHLGCTEVNRSALARVTRSAAAEMYCIEAGTDG